jgi:serine/threonine protein kinase
LGSHDRIPRLLAHFQEGEEFYLVQEFADGTDLTQEIGNGKRSPENVVVALIKEVLEILVYVHDRKVVHRDIKPANLIRRNRDRKIVLIDFGAVKEIGSLAVDPQGNTNLTIAIGSPGYMPIEQLNGKPRFSSDIYAVGMMAIQAITGEEPRLFGEHPDTAELVWRDRIQGNYSPQFLDILDKMVRYDFRQRYQTAAEVLEEISSLPKVTKHDLPTVVSNTNNLTNNSETLITSPQVVTKLPETQQNHPTSSQTVPFAAANRQSPKLWIWITGGVTLLLLIVMAILSKTAKNTSEIPNSPVVINSATPTAIAPLTPPKVLPSPASQTPLSVEELLAQALILNRNNKPQEALVKVEEAIKLEPNSADAWGAKGLLLRSMGREKEAIAAFSKAIELSPNERPIPPIYRELPSKKGDKKK